MKTAGAGMGWVESGGCVPFGHFKGGCALLIGPTDARAPKTLPFMGLHVLAGDLGWSKWPKKREHA